MGVAEVNDRLHREDFPTPDWPLKQARECKAPADLCQSMCHHQSL